MRIIPHMVRLGPCLRLDVVGDGQFPFEGLGKVRLFLRESVVEVKARRI